MGGTVVAALVAPKMAKHWSLATPFWVATGLMAVMTVVFWLTATMCADSGHCCVASPTSRRVRVGGSTI